MARLLDEYELEKVDLRTREAKCAQAFLAHKGYPDIRPMGMISIEGDACWYFYYRLPEGVLELEVDTKDGLRFDRKVSLFLQDAI